MKALKIIIFSIALVLVVLPAWSQDTPLSKGIASFQNGNYQQALASFREIILTSSLEAYHSDAYFWIAKCFIATRNYEEAEKNIDFFLYNFPDHELYPEGYYQKGRLLYLQKQYESAIQALYGYIEEYPRDPYVPNAYFWIGECLFELGHFTDAHKVFTMITQRYPRSFKVEASGYRISLIEFKYRENELLKLIKISHEEYLNALDEFTQREKSYEKALSEYQKKLNTAMSEDMQLTLDSLSSELASLKAQKTQLEAQLAALKMENGNLLSQLEGQRSGETGVSSPVKELSITGDTNKNKLLALKARGLNLKEFLLKELEKEIGGGQ